MGVSGFKLNIHPSVHVHLFTAPSAFAEVDRLVLKEVPLTDVSAAPVMLYFLTS